MTKLSIDIDIIFKSFSGRALLLLNEEGVIFKANNDAYTLLDNKKIKKLAGKTWNSTFANICKEDFSFDTICNASTGFTYFELKDSSSSKLNLLRVKVDTFYLKEDMPGTYYLITCKKQEAGDWEEMLYQVMKGTEKDFGENYIQSVTKALAKTLRVDIAFIGKIKKDDPDTVSILSFWDKDDYLGIMEYALKGTPCEDVVDKKQKLITKDVVEKYPTDTSLAEMNVESYFGTPIFYSNGKPLGLLVVMDRKPMEDNPVSAYILNIFANRVGAEIEFAETQKSLLEKEHKLKSVIDSIPHPIFYKDKKGRYEGVNQAFIDAVELKESEIIGQKSTRPENKNDTAKFDKELLTNPSQKTYESLHISKSGVKRYYLMTKSTILDENGEIEGIAGAAMDITEQKQAEEELKISEEKFRRLFSTANDAIFIMKNGVFIDCNDKTLEMFACKREEIIGVTPYDYSPEKQPDGSESKIAAIKKIQAARKGESQNFYWKHKKKTGEDFDAEVSLNTFYIDDELFIQAIVRDVSEKMQLSKNIELQKERMEEMYKYISSPNISLNDQLNGLLELATRSLGMEIGMLSQIEGSVYTIKDYYSDTIELDKNSSFQLDNTYCDITFGKNRLVGIEHMGESEFNKHPCYGLFKMESYIGVPYWVRGKRYGTLAFMSKTPVTQFRPIDLDFVQMLAQWIGSAVERSEFEQNLLERDALLETMLREIPIDFSVRDANLNMVIQSDLSKEYWGNNEGKPIDYKDVDEKAAKKWRDIFARALKGEVVKGEDHVKIYGKPYTFYSIASPVMVNGKVTEVIVINIDISKLKETEAKLRVRNEQLTKLNSELDRFVYSASHDLRAPLASLLGLIDLTSRERNTDSTKHYLELMSKSINTMDRFISDITEYSRNLRLDTLANKIDFKKLVEDSFSHIQFMMPEPATHTVTIKGNVDFYTDFERLRMVINNLVSNSIRYKAYGRDPHIDFLIEVNDKMAKLTISDNGIGIEEKHIKHVFEMFYRANDKNVGSGLGLFIVKETIEKLNGSISITSELNKGTQVHIELPNLKP